ncbi:MAG: GGDEF domain-containing protein [bacterium]|nr:GGDEF domain-containing protein [bacterium]
MVFGKRKKNAGKDAEAKGEQPVAESAAADAVAAIPADRALDMMADLLRILGEHAFDVGPRSAEEIEETFETWARHLLIGVPPPVRDRGDGESREVGEGKRDLPGLRRAVKEHRLSEEEYVTRSLGDFRDAAWSFISGLRRSLTVEQSADRRIGHRMRRLEGAVRSGEPDKIKNEAQETVSLLTEFLSERGRRHQEQIQQMAARLDTLRDELDNVRKRAAIDPVTKIYNRSAFDEQIEREIDLATLFGTRGCLIMVDLDHFKWVNDTHGHPCGDAVLREVADALTRCFMRKDDFVARYGGEEFAIVLRDIDLPTARDVAERGMTTVRNLEIFHGEIEEPIRVTASMGIARLRQGETSSSWVERADRALYQAKDGGRDRIEVDPIDLDEA